MAHNDFIKVFVLDSITPASSGDTWDLTPGQIGMFNKNTNAVIAPGSESGKPYVYFAQGSYYTVDKVGKSTPLTGLKESVKSTGINAKYVTKFYKQVGKAPKQHSIQVGLETVAPLVFEANTTYNLRVQAKGSPALRTIQRHFYRHIPFYTGCETNGCLSGCDKEYVDPAKVMYNWAKYINEDPLTNMFVAAKAYKVAVKSTYTNAAADTSIVVAERTGIVAGQLVRGEGIPVGTKVASGYTPATGSGAVTLDTASEIKTDKDIYFCTELTDSSTFEDNSTTAFTGDTKKAFMVLTAAYIDTVFGDCSFRPTDFYSVEPLLLDASLVDDTGEPCKTGTKINSNSYFTTNFGSPENVKELQPAVQVQGIGESVLRRYLVSREYEGLHFSTNPRIREVEKDPIFDVISRTDLYNVYYLQYHVPTHVNPSNVMASNEYLISFAIKQSDDSSASGSFGDMVNDWLSANGSSVTLVTYS